MNCQNIISSSGIAKVNLGWFQTLFRKTGYSCAQYYITNHMDFCIYYIWYILVAMQFHIYQKYNVSGIKFETNPSFQPNLSSISVLLRTLFFGRGPWSQNVSIWPLPFISTMPRVSKLKSCGSRTFLTSDVTWIRFGDPEDSILEATLTVFPQISNWGLRAPMTPATTGPTLRPIRSFYVFSIS